MPRWRASPRCSCSTTRPIRPAWSTRTTKSRRWPMCSSSIRTPGSSPTTSTTAWCSTASAITTSCRREPELRDRVIFVDSRVQDLRHAGLARRLRRGSGRGGAGHHHAQLESHHQPAGSHHGRGRRCVHRSAGCSASQVRGVRRQARHRGECVACDSWRGMPASARRVLRVSRYFRGVRQEPQRCDASTATSTSALRCSKPRAWPACRVRLSASRAPAHFLHLSRRHSCCLGWSVSRRSSPN